MKSVLFLLDTLNVGGAEKSLLDITSCFKKYKPIVCHIYPGDFLKKEFIDRNIEVHSLDIPVPYNFRKAISSVSRLVNELDPTIIHSTLFRSDIVSRFVAARKKIILVNSLVNNSYHVSRFNRAGVLMKAKLKGLQWIDSLTSRRVDLFISNSHTIKKAGVNDLNIPEGRIEVIHRGRFPGKYLQNEPGRVERLRGELNIGSEKVLLNVSRLLYRKGHLDLIRAIDRVLIEYRDFVLLIAGDGPFRKELEREIEGLKLGKHVKLLGNRDDIPALLALSDYFVFPSHYEGLPGALIEAMMANVPIIASSIPENLECIDSGTAFLHRPGDVDDLATVLVRVLKSAEIARDKARKAQAQALRKFDVESIATQYESVYDQLLEDR